MQQHHCGDRFSAAYVEQISVHSVASLRPINRNCGLRYQVTLVGAATVAMVE